MTAQPLGRQISDTDVRDVLARWDEAHGDLGLACQRCQSNQPGEAIALRPGVSWDVWSVLHEWSRIDVTEAQRARVRDVFEARLR